MQGAIMRRIRSAALVATSMLGLGLIGGSAQATPGSGVSGTVISQTTVNGTDFVLKELTVQPGGYTGWHYHDGPLYGVVKKGTVTRTFTAGNCFNVETYIKGQTFVEPPGTSAAHFAQNLGNQPVVLLVLYVLPAGAPLTEDAPYPGCGPNPQG
jgi:quercetin dioxygenase-like cupin family protein